MKTEPKHEPLLASTPPYHLRTRHLKPQPPSLKQPPSTKTPPRKKPKKTSLPSTTFHSTTPRTLFNNLQRLSDHLDDHLPLLAILTLQITAALLIALLAATLLGLVVGLPLLFLWRAAEGAWTWVSGPDKGWGMGEGRHLCLSEVQIEVPGSLVLAVLMLVEAGFNSI